MAETDDAIDGDVPIPGEAIELDALGDGDATGPDPAGGDDTIHFFDEQPRTFHGLTVAAVGVAILALALAKQIDAHLIGLVLVAPVLLVLRVLLARRDARRVAIARLRTSWGRPTRRTRDPGALRRLYVACSGAGESRAALDDATWDDLDLDVIYERLDRTLSVPGEYVLYEMLRTPRLDGALLDRREASIDAITEDDGLRDVLRDELRRLDRGPLDPLTAVLFGPPPQPHDNPAMLTFRAVLPVLAIVAAVLGAGMPAVLVALVAVVTNATSHFRLKNEIAAAADGIWYLAALVKSARRIGALSVREESRALAPLLADVAAVSRAAAVVGSKGGRVGWSDSGGGADVLQSLYEYVCILFLTEVRSYYKILAHVATHMDDLRRLFRTVGELDALQSVASWRAGLSRFCRPEIHESPVALRIVEGVHPLLDSPVPNTVELGAFSGERSLVVTGSNMSGKSTLLRMVGLSAILAQTVHTVLADAYVACPLRIGSSVTIRDDVVAGRSFYLAEAERLLRLVRFAEDEGPALVLVDEPLRGTNSTERVAAATEILLHLSRVGALTIVATHEQRLSELIADGYMPCHLGDEVGADGLRFPHRIVPGIATTRNAIALLGKIGYPDDLVRRAESRAAAIRD